MLPAPQVSEKLPQPTDPKTGRFLTPYSQETFFSIAERIANGETLTEICKEPGMPDRVNVWRWAQRDPEIAKALAEARAISAHVLEEEMAAIEHKLLTEHIPNQFIRAYDIALTSKRWRAGKRNTQAYSDKVPNVPTTVIQINTDLWSTDGNLQPAEFQVIATVPQEGEK